MHIFFINHVLIQHLLYTGDSISILFYFFSYACEVGIRSNHMKLLIFNDF